MGVGAERQRPARSPLRGVSGEVSIILRCMVTSSARASCSRSSIKAIKDTNIAASFAGSSSADWISVPGRKGPANVEAARETRQILWYEAGHGLTANQPPNRSIAAFASIPSGSFGATRQINQQLSPKHSKPGFWVRVAKGTSPGTGRTFCEFTPAPTDSHHPQSRSSNAPDRPCRSAPAPAPRRSASTRQSPGHSACA